MCSPVGGREDLRPYWRMYVPKAVMLVFVVDASRPQLFPVARQHLHQLLASAPRLPLMVLANKQVSVTGGGALRQPPYDDSEIPFPGSRKLPSPSPYVSFRTFQGPPASPTSTTLSACRRSASAGCSSSVPMPRRAKQSPARGRGTPGI